MGVANLPDTLPTDIANGVLQGLAGGTFLYITFFEVLPHELNVPSKRFWKVFFVIIGYAALCATAFGRVSAWLWGPGGSGQMGRRRGQD